MKLMIAAFVAGLLLFSARANAQVKPGDNQVSLDLGLSNPWGHDVENGDSEPFGKIGPTLGFGFLHQFQKNLSFGGDFSYKSLGTRDVSTGHGPLEIKTSAWTLMAVGRADVLPEGNLRPYGLVGLGVGGAKVRRDYSFSPALSADRSSTGPALALAAGADYDVNPKWLVGAELRYSIIKTDADELGTDSVSTIDMTLRIAYKF